MNRRALAIAAAAATAVAVLPATPAFASANATASLGTADQQVFPGAESFAITVTNAESAGVLGLMPGKTINAVRVNLPVNEAGIKLGPDAGTAAGCATATKSDLGTTQFITYRGCNLAPGASTTLTFPAQVGQPLSRDLKGDFRVQVSSDDFQTAKPVTGTLITEVNVLEVLAGSVKPVSPTNADGSKGVTDGTGTAGQSVTYASTIKNHSRSPLTVAAGLVSTEASDSVTPASVVVQPLQTAVASIPVTTTSAGDRTFEGTATAPNAGAPTGQTSLFRAQVAAAFSFLGISNNRTMSKGADREFTVTLEKTGEPAVDLFDTTLTFLGNSCASKAPVTFPAGTSTQEITYVCTNIIGADGTYPASIAFGLTDANLFKAAGTITSADLNVVIDNLAPIIDLVVSLPNDRDGDRQTAVKDNDTLTVSGTVTNAGDLAANAVTVTLQPTDGSEALVIQAPLGGAGEARTFSATGSKDWADTAEAFTSRAEIKDTAGNIGGVQLPVSTLIDNKAPTLLPTPTSRGVIVEPTIIEVTYSDRTAVRGGCDPSLWLIDGRPGRVSEVRTGDGRACNETSSKVRRLVLSSALGPDTTPTVTYDPTGVRQTQFVSNRRPTKDGAGNDAVREIVDTVTNLVPPAPAIINLLRRDGSSSAAFEPAYLDTDETRYYTNVGGTEALELEVAGVKQGYAVEVRDADGTRRGFQQFTAAPPFGASEYNGKVRVDLPAGVGIYGYTVRLVSTQGNPGLTTPFSVAFETTAPELAAATRSGNTVRAPFSEKVVAGSDFADNWFVSETVATEEGTATRTVNVDSVTADGLSARALQVTLLDPAKFVGVDYFQQSGTRYEDRAGNPLADTLKPVV